MAIIRRANSVLRRLVTTKPKNICNPLKLCLWRTKAALFLQLKTESAIALNSSNSFGWLYLAFWFEMWINYQFDAIFICVLSARHVSGLYAHLQEQWMLQYLTYAAYGFLGVARCRSWGVCVLVSCCTEECVCWWRVAVQHATSTHTPQNRHLVTPRTPYAAYVRYCNIHCSWRWAYKPETCRAESTHINIASSW